MNRNKAARRVALTGVLFALALVLSVLESAITPLMGLPPGIKIGLANIVVMYALFFLSARQALLLVVLKAGFGLLMRGAIAGLLSISGGLLSLGVMLLLRLPKKRPFGIAAISVAGALAHNAGQMLVVVLLFGPFAAYYLFVLIASGLGMGLLTAGTLRALLPALQKTGIAPEE